MKTILLNATNLKAGGGIQVADSVCREIAFGDVSQTLQRNNIVFIMVLSPYLKITSDAVKSAPHVKVLEYEIKYTPRLLMSGRDEVLDSLVENYQVSKVLTIFGPSWWVPNVPHLCGFASGQITPQDSPFYKMKMPIKLRAYEMVRNLMLKTYYGKCSRFLYSENESVSEALRKMYPKKKVYTVTNYYNQVFDNPSSWKRHLLPHFEGTTMLTIAKASRHKNVGISIRIAKILRENYPGFNFRFVFTATKEEFPAIPKEYEENFLLIGSVAVSECPSLYEQCDIEFQPSLLECFTATYPEAMRMGKPIITTDLAFARALCRDAAEYYSALDPCAAAAAIFKVASDVEFSKQLVANGKKQLAKFDTYESRANKLVRIVMEIQ